MKEYFLTSSFSSELNATIWRDCSNRTHHIADVGEREGKVNYCIWSHEGVCFDQKFLKIKWAKCYNFEGLFKQNSPHRGRGRKRGKSKLFSLVTWRSIFLYSIFSSELPKWYNLEGLVLFTDCTTHVQWGMETQKVVSSNKNRLCKATHSLFLSCLDSRIFCCKAPPGHTKFVLKNWVLQRLVWIFIVWPIRFGPY